MTKWIESLLNICGQDFFVKILDWILTTEKNLIWKSQENRKENNEGRFSSFRHVVSQKSIENQKKKSTLT